jgi:hypothetical protein
MRVGRGVHELRAGDRALGRLELRGRMWAVWGERRWRIRGNWRGSIRAEEENGQVAARWERIYRRGGTVVLADGRRFEASRHGRWSQRWELLDAGGQSLFVLSPRSGFGRCEAEISLEAASAAEPDLGLLCLLACVVARRVRDSGAAAATSTAVSSG